MNDQMEKLAVVLQSQQRSSASALPVAPDGARAVKMSGGAMPGGGAKRMGNRGSRGGAPSQQPRPASSRQGAVARELHDDVRDYIGPDSFSRGNNTNFFFPYADYDTPENIYRFLGTVDVTDLVEAVKQIPEVSAPPPLP